ncbi:putative autotransporter adhesin-like protein [Aquimarina sp. MAR_2010_214]|uniref:head GIN domain-containing protein n=1 Tax=Aquimarina sp. MAR_2010_214 TaxID=1250026 RepID=UPI000CABA975|nr:head GIN domain-containing protein [Aquimarina sp. MAR_2010_214]PKV49640.1 putative autotransporter adhesin-like protein [Aquimarina sp. MAR_2010_214]
MNLSIRLKKQNVRLNMSKSFLQYIMVRCIGIWVVLFLFGCDSENASDCFQRTGTIVRKEIEVADFTRILVNPNIELIIKEGATTSVIIETGDNLLNEVSAIVEDDRLVLSNTNDCAFFRDSNQTKIFVTAPNINEVRSGTQFDISSDGVLRYASLTLLSEDFGENTETTTGTFHIQIDNESVSVVGNNIASFFVEGKTKLLNVNFASGTGRFEGANLVAENVQIFHRGTNKIIVNPQQSITGEIRSTGDVISVNRPSVIEVEEFFTGKLIFQ